MKTKGKDTAYVQAGAKLPKTANLTLLHPYRLRNAPCTSEMAVLRAVSSTFEQST